MLLFILLRVDWIAEVLPNWEDMSNCDKIQTRIASGFLFSIKQEPDKSQENTIYVAEIRKSYVCCIEN